MKQINKLVISIFLIFIALFCTEVIFKTKDKEILETFRNENSSKKQYVYPLGNIVGIKANTDGALVIGFEEKNIEYITMMFCDKYYYFKLYDHSGIKIDYDNFLYENSVKGELVRLVKADDALDDDTKAAIIAIGIKALTGEEYI